MQKKISSSVLGKRFVFMVTCNERMQKWNGRSCGKVQVRPKISGTWVAAALESSILAILFGLTVTVADESRKKMADNSVTRSPTRFRSRDGKICYCVWTPWVRFSCFCGLLPTFLIFSFLIPVCLLRVPSSVQQPSWATLSEYIVYTYQVYYSIYVCMHIRVLSSCVISILPHLRIPLFFVQKFLGSSYFSGGVFVVRSYHIYPVRYS